MSQNGEGVRRVVVAVVIGAVGGAISLGVGEGLRLAFERNEEKREKEKAELDMLGED